ncbi:hypothetical protein AB0P15_02565 [Streptomyces sp. NPDC087917]|uniref:hypothetical protein n=1 Tax=Streptomyces sp. NPDC087917 TaxID=3155060 RepID=UPI0034120E91
MGANNDFADLSAETFQVEIVGAENDPTLLAWSCTGSTNSCCSTSGTPVGEGA